MNEGKPWGTRDAWYLFAPVTWAAVAAGGGWWPCSSGGWLAVLLAGAFVRVQGTKSKGAELATVTGTAYRGDRVLEVCSNLTAGMHAAGG